MAKREVQVSEKPYPSKRVKNHLSRKLRKLFKLKGRVTLKTAEEIVFPEGPCYGLCYSNGIPGQGKGSKHVIVLSAQLCDTLPKYLSTLMHEYVHVWQFENGSPRDHKKEFKKWRECIGQRYGIYI